MSNLSQQQSIPEVSENNLERRIQLLNKYFEACKSRSPGNEDAKFRIDQQIIDIIRTNPGISDEEIIDQLFKYDFSPSQLDITYHLEGRGLRPNSNNNVTSVLRRRFSKKFKDALLVVTAVSAISVLTRNCGGCDSEENEPEVTYEEIETYSRAQEELERVLGVDRLP
jgi:hypothetical protein